MNTQTEQLPIRTNNPISTKWIKNIKDSYFFWLQRPMFTELDFSQLLVRERIDPFEYLPKTIELPRIYRSRYSQTTEESPLTEDERCPARSKFVEGWLYATSDY